MCSAGGQVFRAQFTGTQLRTRNYGHEIMRTVSTHTIFGIMFTDPPEEGHN
jgi:hypothetical protein